MVQRSHHLQSFTIATINFVNCYRISVSLFNRYGICFTNDHGYVLEMVHDSKQNPGANHIMNRIFCAAFQLYLVTLKHNNSTGIEVYEHFILQEAGYVPCIPLTRISTETSLFHWSKESSVHKRMYYHGPYTKCNLLLLAIGGI